MGRNRPHPQPPPSPSSSSSEASSSSSSSSEASSEEEEGNETQISIPSPSSPDKNPKAMTAASLDKDDDEEEEDQESGDEEDSAPESAGKIQSQPQVLNPTPKPASSDSSDSGSSDSSDSKPETPPRRPSRSVDPNIKPISSKPMDEPPQSKQVIASPAQLSVSDKKKGKALEPVSDSGDKKTNLFQRLWSFEDEIALLKGLEKYRAEKGLVPSSMNQKNDFHDFVRKSLNITVNTNQIAEKVRRLRKKYENAISHAKKGEQLNFATPHDRDVYEISTKVWEPPADGIRDGGKVKEEQVSLTINGKEDLGKNTGRCTFLREAISQLENGRWESLAEMRVVEFDPAKARFLEEKFKKHRRAEMKHHLRTMDLLKETLKAIIDAQEKSG